METANTLSKETLNVNNTVVESCDFMERPDGIRQITISEFARMLNCSRPTIYKYISIAGNGK